MSKNSLNSIWNIYNKLCDEESKRVFLSRFNYIIRKDENELFEWFMKEHKELYCPELDDYEADKMQTDYILFGAGAEGRKAKRILEATKRNVIAWCDNNRELWGGELEGKKIISPGDLINDYKDSTVVITARYHLLQVYQQLVMMGFLRERIVLPKNGFILGFAGQQYFDVFPASEQEVFVDAGCWDGSTSKTFIEWCKGNYDHIYAFEPDKACWRNCERTFETNDMKKISFIKKGTWSKEDVLCFEGTGRGSSSIQEQKNSACKVEVTSIDEVLKGKKVTFIKMDIEGSELEALKGAEKSIKKYKPKLAICVYHKPQDLWELAEYVLELNPNYKLYMRHYTTCNYETVLYAV